MTVFKKTEGIAAIGPEVVRSEIFIRITIDDYGKSLSLSDDRRALIMAPLADIKKAIREAEKKGSKSNG